LTSTAPRLWNDENSSVEGEWADLGFARMMDHSDNGVWECLGALNETGPNFRASLCSWKVFQL